MSSGPCGRRRSAPPCSGFPGAEGEADSAGRCCLILLPPPLPSALSLSALVRRGEEILSSSPPPPPRDARPGHFCYLETFPPRECPGPSPHGTMDKWHRRSRSRIRALLDAPYSGPLQALPLSQAVALHNQDRRSSLAACAPDPPRSDPSLSSLGVGWGQAALMQQRSGAGGCHSQTAAPPSSVPGRRPNARRISPLG